MPSWNELQREFQAQQPDLKGQWLVSSLQQQLQKIGQERGDRNVILYGSAFLQKPSAASDALMITHEEINGLMSVMYGMDWGKGLTLILHTPGGVTNATETIVAYLWSKFQDVEVIVPTYAMSAGTMIALASNRIIMGRQSQLGPIDPQMPFGGRTVSARAIVEQFDQGKADVLANVTAAHVWAPILQSLGPSLLQEAQNALAYSEQMVARWLAERMFVAHADAEARGQLAAHHFNDASTHKSHGRRIGRDEARAHGLEVEDLEADQGFQDTVLTAYHLFTLVCEQTDVLKMMVGSTGTLWAKNGAVATS